MLANPLTDFAKKKKYQTKLTLFNIPLSHQRMRELGELNTSSSLYDHTQQRFSLQYTC